MRPRAKQVPQLYKHKQYGLRAETNSQIHQKLKKMSSNNLSLKDYAHIYAQIHYNLQTPDKHNFMTSDVVTTVLTQYHVSKGIKVFGQEGIDAVLKELKQLHDRMVLEPKRAEKNDPCQKEGKSTISHVFEKET